MKSSHQAAALTAAAAYFVAPSSAQLYNAPIKIKDGYVQGYQPLRNETAANLTSWQTITAWKGIPFAASTAGNNRWKPPQPATPWNTTLDAFEYGPGCPQAASPTSGDDTESEDCLSVNIWSPALSANESLPVAVWNYGAGSTSSDDNFNGAGVADKGIVFVTYNYRTGPFGWMTLPALSAENPRNISGNYGLFDQIKILEWVQENIAAFGGDPNHVTNMGQSFGSGAVLHTINSPLSKGLFHGAIAESGIKSPYDPDLSNFGSNYITLEDAYIQSEAYVASLNVTTLEELRALTADELLLGTSPSSSKVFDPVLDYYAIPCTYEQSLLRGPANDVPILAGNNLDEDGVNVSAVYFPEEYYFTLVDLYNDTYANTFEQLYPPGNTTNSTTLAYNTQVRDETKISTWLFANQWARTAKSPFYTYWWTHAPTGTDGATHGSEIDYVLNTLWADDPSAYADDDYAISGVMSSYWANFIKTGNPNKGGSYEKYYPGKGNLTYWPASHESSPTVFEVGTGYEVQDLAASVIRLNTVINWMHYATPYQNEYIQGEAEIYD